jgi:GNAT superfamily N-acetyltransferase
VDVVVIEPLDLLGRAAETGAVQEAALGPVPPDRYAVLNRHVHYPGFRAFGAFEDDRMVGYTYGTDCAEGQWWFDQVRRGLLAAQHVGWVDHAHAVTELHVLPGHQGRGVGYALLNRLLAATDRPIALLSTYDLLSAARRLYRRVGFQDLVTGFRFGVTPQPFALMGAHLPLNAGSGRRDEAAEIPESRG